MLVLDNLHIGYKSVLFEVSDLKLSTGQLVSLIGPNGSGKTTFLNTILGITKPLNGEVLVENESISEISKAIKVKLLSHVASKFDGVSHLTVYELIAMGRAPYTNMLNRLTSEDHKIVSEIIQKLNLTELQSESTTNISDGERQIAMIGKALAQETKMIILDEPTAFLDYSNRLKVMKLLKNIAINENKLIVISTHNIEICLEFSNVILAVDNKNRTLRKYMDKVSKEELISDVFNM
ncbi:MAG: ABC transporter ATP-binding protein [Fluviicola sp.]|nr:MAG: ABC transporter ATP-binding protein [Fluviicola sp.]